MKENYFMVYESTLYENHYIISNHNIYWLPPEMIVVGV